MEFLKKLDTNSIFILCFILCFILSCGFALDSKIDDELGSDDKALELTIEALNGFDFGTVLVDEYSQSLSFNLSSKSNKVLYFNLDDINENNSKKIVFSSSSFPGRNGTCGVTLNISSPCKIELQVFSSDLGLIDEEFKIYYSDKLIKKEAIINLKANIVENSSKDILSFTINGLSSHIIGNNIFLILESGTDLSSLTPTILISGKQVVPASGIAQNFTNSVLYTVTAQDNTTKEYLVNVTKHSSTQKELLSFLVAGQSSQTLIDEDNLTISLSMPFNTDLRTIVANFISTGEKVEVDDIIQISGVSINDFTNPITYTVTAEDESTKTYLVNISIQDPLLGHKYNINFDTDINHKIVFIPSNLSYKKGYTNNIEVNVENAFWIGETELTANVYYFIKAWAESNAYSFCNDGNGTGNLPISRISWRDSIVWTNALTAWYNFEFEKNLEPVYYTDVNHTSILKIATCSNSIDYNLGSEDFPYIKETANGFRLLNADEWELAARFRGSNSLNGAYEHPLGSNYFWTPGSYASGANSCHNCNDYIDTMEVAWFNLNSDLEVKIVADKNPNILNLFDMSGNVWEWANDIVNNPKRIRLGGSFNNQSTILRLANRESSENTYFRHISIGFRIARKY